MGDSTEQNSEVISAPQWFVVLVRDTGDFFSSIPDGWEAAKPFAPNAVLFLCLMVVSLAASLKFMMGGRSIGKLLGPLTELIGHLRKRPAREAVTSPSLVTGHEAARGGWANAVLMWCALCDQLDLNRLQAGYKDGPIQAKYQLNMGLAVIAVSIWSSMAFCYAVLSSGAGFGSSGVALVLVAVVGAFLYGLLVLALDRSIVAPFTPDGTAAATGNDMHAWLRRMPLYVRTFARIVIALIVAKFTAVPIAALIMHGAIKRDLVQQREQTRAAREQLLGNARQRLEGAKAQRQGANLCLTAKTAVEDLRAKLDVAITQGCPGRVCAGPQTERIKTLLSEAKHSVTTDCALSPSEEAQLSNAIAEAKKAYEEVKDPSSIDILTAATGLNRLEAQYYRDNATIEQSHAGLMSRNPISATFWLLVVIELIPALTKLWREGLVDRRSGGRHAVPTVTINDRRLALPAIPGPEREAAA
ncbi:MAG: DUF4407 domain-containing protein [Burkholderiales bacterium]|nr:DUF4407 domain-containing protein [Burkholderiales bacterium]